jgi:hypothetical protein
LERCGRDNKCKRQVALAASVAICALVASACAAAKASYSSIVKTTDAVYLVPDTSVSGVGWCAVVEDEEMDAIESQCPRVGRGGLLPVEGWAEGSSPAIARGYALTASDVSAVSVDGGPAIPTQYEAGLPYGLRAVSVELRGVKKPFDDAYRFTPLDARGRPLARRGGDVLRLNAGVPVISVGIGKSNRGCDLTAKPLVGLRPKDGNAVRRIRSYHGVFSRPFLTCVVWEYSIDGWPASASVLLDAEHPGASPRALPGMRPLPGHSGVVQAPSRDGLMVARRVARGWLAVEGAHTLRQRLVLLSDLEARVRA